MLSMFRFSYVVCIIHVKDPTSLAEVQDTTPSSSSTTDSQAPSTKKARTSPPTMTSSSAPVSTSTSPIRRRTRSSYSKNTAQLSLSQTSISTTTISSTNSNLSSDTSLPEGIKLKIYNELMELEKRDMLGVRYLMLEQGMRIRF